MSIGAKQEINSRKEIGTKKRLVSQSEPRSRRRWWMLSLFLVPVIVVWLAPWVVAYTPLRHWVAKMALDVNGSVAVGSASLGWFSPIELSDIEVRDPAGEVVVRLGRLSGDTTLASLAASQSQLGTLVIDNPELRVVLREGGSNVEDTFARWLEKKEPASARPSVQLQVNNGAVVIVDTGAKAEWQLNQLQVAAKIAAGEASPVDVTATCNLAGDAPGRLELKLRTPDAAEGAPADPAANADDPRVGRLALVADAMPLAMLQSLARRFVPGATLAGMCSADLHGQWSGEAATATAMLQGSFVANRLVFGASALGSDTIRIEQIKAPCRIAKHGERIAIDELAVETDIGSASVKGSVRVADLATPAALAAALRESYVVEGRVDLARLAQMLPGTLRVREGTQITEGQVRWTLESRPDAGEHVWQGQLTTDNLVAMNAGRRHSWERPIQISFAARDTERGLNVDQLRWDSNFLQATASGTLDNLTASATYDLNALVAELDQFVDLGEFRIAGQGRTDVTWRRVDDGMFDSTAVGEIRNLVFVVRGLNIQEPTARIDTAGQWNSTARKMQFSKASLVSETLVADSADLAMTLANKGMPAFTGEINCQGDVARLQRWFHDPRTPLRWQWAGRMSGQATIRRDEQGASALAAASFANLSITDGARQAADGGSTRNRSAGSQVVWQERQVDVAANGRYDSARDSLRLESCEIASDALRLRATGSVERISRDQLVDLSGKADYDWDKLTPLLWTVLGTDVKFTGRESRSFAVRGPLVPTGGGDKQSPPSIWHQFTAEAGIGWETAELFGLKVGKGELAAKVADGMLKITPIDWELSEGRVKFAPVVRLAPPPSEIQLSKGPVIEKVRLTQEMCTSGLKLVAPALADATRPDGRISLDLSGGRVPLDDPGAGDLAGTLAIHSVQVLPGPGTRSLVGLVLQVESLLKNRALPQETDVDTTQLLTIADQNVQFRMVDRRVYHRGLEMTVAGAKLKTQGSVGVDESLDLLAELTIPDQWVGADPITSKFKNQVIQIPVRGTLSKPALDSGAIQQIAGQLLRNTARGMLQDELGKQLDKLLRPKEK